MLNNDAPFEAKADFLKRNIADFPGTLDSSDISGPDAASVLEGLGQYRALLLALYSDPKAFQAGTDLDSFHNLTYSASFFLYAALAEGKLRWEGVNSYLQMKKPEFKKQYRKSSLFPFRALEEFGVYFVYEKQFKPVDSYSKCDSFQIHFECGNYIAFAMDYLSSRLKPVDSRNDYVLSVMDLIALADFEAILKDKTLNRTRFDPLDARILRTAGERRAAWEAMVEVLVGGYRFNSSCSLFSYAPVWIVRMSRGREYAAIFTLTADRISAEINPNFEELAGLARAIDILPDIVRSTLAALGCIGCGRCAVTAQAIETVNGVRICPREAYARRLVFNIQDKQDVQSVVEVIGKLLPER